MVNELFSLHKLQVFSWVYLAVLTLGSWLIVSWSFAGAVLVGGIISILSFRVSHRDIVGFLESTAPVQEGEDEKKKARKRKLGLAIKFWFRIFVIGMVLFVLIRSHWVGRDNIVGLLLGLSTVVFTVTFTALIVARHYFFSGRR